MVLRLERASWHGDKALTIVINNRASPFLKRAVHRWAEAIKPHPQPVSYTNEINYGFLFNNRSAIPFLCVNVAGFYEHLPRAWGLLSFIARGGTSCLDEGRKEYLAKGGEFFGLATTLELPPPLSGIHVLVTGKYICSPLGHIGYCFSSWIYWLA